jgi:hypothetical protein
MKGRQAQVSDEEGGARLVHEIYEGDTLTVTHVFHGDTKKRAEEVKRAHMETDRFLRAAETDGDFEGIPLRVEEHWSGDDDEKKQA